MEKSDKKKFDCIKLKRKIQEKMFKQSGEDIKKIIQHAEMNAKTSSLWAHFTGQ